MQSINPWVKYSRHVRPRPPRRAQLTSAQLPTYFVGAQEHFDTRKAVEAKLGDKFNAKAYHDQVLSYGAPPVRFVRELMLDQPIQ